MPDDEDALAGILARDEKPTREADEDDLPEPRAPRIRPRSLGAMTPRRDPQELGDSSLAGDQTAQEMQPKANVSPAGAVLSKSEAAILAGLAREDGVEELRIWSDFVAGARVTIIETMIPGTSDRDPDRTERWIVSGDGKVRVS